MSADQNAAAEVLIRPLMCISTGSPGRVGISTPLQLLVGDAPAVVGTLCIEVVFDADMHPVAKSCQYVFKTDDGEVIKR